MTLHLQFTTIVRYMQYAYMRTLYMHSWHLHSYVRLIITSLKYAYSVLLW